MNKRQYPVSLPLSEVHNERSGLLGADKLIIIVKANHCCVICKLDNGVGTMNRRAVVVKEEVEHTALWDTGVKVEEVWFANLTYWGLLVRNLVSSYRVVTRSQFGDGGDEGVDEDFSA